MQHRDLPWEQTKVEGDVPSVRLPYRADEAGVTGEWLWGDALVNGM